MALYVNTPEIAASSSQWYQGSAEQENVSSKPQLLLLLSLIN
jgi:hypothetical protein